MQGKTARADSVNEKWPENLACCHKRIYLNACAAHDRFPFKNDDIVGIIMENLDDHVVNENGVVEDFNKIREGGSG